MGLFAFLSSFAGEARAAQKRISTMAQLREEVINALKREPWINSAKPSPTDPAKIDLLIGEMIGESDLTNLFAYLESNPDEDAGPHIKQFVRSLHAGFNKSPKDSNIVAVVRTTSYIEQLRGLIQDPVHEELSAGLQIVYMVDSPDAMSPMSLEDLGGKSLARLRDIALKNVKPWLSKLGSEAVGPGMFYYVEENPPIVMGLILLDEFWAAIRSRFPGDVLIALPRRDQLFVFDARDSNSESAARRMIDVTFRDGFNLLSDSLYERRNGQIVVRAE